MELSAEALNYLSNLVDMDSGENASSTVVDELHRWLSEQATLANLPAYEETNEA